jgi:hypothetical protein
MMRAGWRFFTCDECGEEWKETSRDMFSPSGVDCQNCGAWSRPNRHTTEPKVPVDNMGNLLRWEIVQIEKGRTPKWRDE